MASQYRPDIDGLRSVAIIPVVLFHAGVSQLAGGFVGVDVFFVISGFLIAGIIDREVREKRFSIIKFYERRIRRIVPALGLVLIFVLVGSWLLFLPSDFPSVQKSAIATLAFVANIFFWASTGYFDATADLKPLLHTWSLAVEEQFYVFFPVVLILIARTQAKTRAIVIWALALSSLAASVFVTRTNPDFAFYMLVTRAWELLVGSLLAVGAIPTARSAAMREVIAGAGLASILWAVFTFQEHMSFPGANALFPVLGAAALIHSAPGTLVGRLLSTAPAVGVGLISYSLYLWHWPLIVFTQYVTERPLEGWMTVAVIVASMFFAILSWRFVERPFRSNVGFSSKSIFTMAGVAAASIGGLALVGLAGHGWPQRFSARVVSLDRGSTAFSPFRERCHRVDDEPVAMRKAACKLGADVPATTLVWGDSHGVELSYSLSKLAKDRGQALLQETGSSCTPFVGAKSKINSRCKVQNEAVMAFLKGHKEIRTVVLSAFWTSADNQNRYGLPAALEETVLQLLAMNRRVVIIGGEPTLSYAVPRHLALAANYGRLAEVHGIPKTLVVERMRYIQPTFRRLASKGVIVVEPTNSLCLEKGDRTTFCDLIRDGRTLYFDTHHLSIYGAGLVAQLAAPRIWDN